MIRIDDVEDEGYVGKQKKPRTPPNGAQLEDKLQHETHTN